MYVLSSVVLAESSVDNVHRHRTSWLLNCPSSSETISDSLSSPNCQLTFSGHVHVLLDCIHSSLPRSYLVFSLSFLFHQSIPPSIHPPPPTPTYPSIHPPTHPSIRQSTHPLTHIPTHMPQPTHPIERGKRREVWWMILCAILFNFLCFF